VTDALGEVFDLLGLFREHRGKVGERDFLRHMLESYHAAVGAQGSGERAHEFWMITARKLDREERTDFGVVAPAVGLCCTADWDWVTRARS
jgi:hypothetical protein